MPPSGEALITPANGGKLTVDLVTEVSGVKTLVGWPQEGKHAWA